MNSEGSRTLWLSSIDVRPAGIGDAAAISTLMTPAVRRGLVLFRSVEQIREDVGCFQVADRDGELVGCVALRDFGHGLFEVRSLVVDERYAGSGLGSELVLRVIELARGQGGKKLFSLTYRPNLFLRLGFVKVDKEMFPQKVWADCAGCAKRDSCDEIALLYRLSG